MRLHLYYLVPLLAASLAAQSTSGGTLQGIVKDQSGSIIPGARITLQNAITSYRATVQSDATGTFRLPNIPFNTYHLEARQANFAPFSQDLDIRNTVPQNLEITLKVGNQNTALEVHAFGDEVLENVPYAHTDASAAMMSKLPVSAPGSLLSDAIMFSAPGVVADSDGFFHPLGDHAQTGFSIDGQPITDQQSKRFSTQLPLNAIQSMELITGAPNAEYGDKTSLVVNTITKSGLGLDRISGSTAASYGSFGTVSTENTLAMGTKRWGNFLSANAERSGRFLDTPEFRPYHAIGNGQSIFNRFDYQINDKNAFHLNILGARNWFQIPNTLDNLDSDQRQNTRSLNIAPSFQHTYNANLLLSFNAFFRKDWVDFIPSRNSFADSPVTAAQNRTLNNNGFRSDVAYFKGRINFKTGFQYSQTNLAEDFRLGITNPEALGDDFSEALEPYDLTRPNGRYFRFNEKASIKQSSWYAQNALTLGNLILNTGLRIDYYNGIVTRTGVQPRGGFSYRIKQTGTILRGSYSRTMETPYNENLLLSSSTGPGGLAANAFFGFGTKPLEPGNRNQYNLGLQQAIGNFMLLEGDYFWKFTRNAYDFGVLFNTPITFPVSWYKSNISGVSFRLSTKEWRGFQAFTTIGSTRARFFPNSTGGLLFVSPLEGGSVFRIDHDQKYQQNTHFRYQFPQRGPWVSLTHRFDSGLVTTGIPSCEDGDGLTDNQKATIGFRSTPAGCTSNLINIPQPGTENDDHNPARMKGRNLFHLGAGHDNVFNGDKLKVNLRLGIINLTNKVALYNFLSTFGGTHFVTPRMISASIGLSF
jgi:hypothetical protein